MKTKTVSEYLKLDYEIVLRALAEEKSEKNDMIAKVKTKSD